MKGITPDALFKYFKELINIERIQILLHKAKRYKVFKPIFKIVPSCGPQWGGMTYGADTIEVSSWILKDAKAAKGVIRHELAHAIQDFLGIEGRPHGKEFIQTLKTISPRFFLLTCPLTIIFSLFDIFFIVLIRSGSPLL